MSVQARFREFLNNISLTEAQKSAGTGHRQSATACLNAAYYGSESESANSLAVGSWGKLTRIRPPRDVDMLFELPVAVYNRYQQRSGNRQSQLLQEVRGHLLKAFSSTVIRGDGPVVVIPFSAFNVEVIPAFRLNNGTFYVCMTEGGGHYKAADYNAEMRHITASAADTNGNTRQLIRMIKCWQGYCGVEIKSFWVELTAVSFLGQWKYKAKSAVYYDWMIRDYLAYLLTKKNSYVYAPGTGELMNLGEKWESKGISALSRATKACEFETREMPLSAGDEWQKIFGTYIPRDPK